ncbi:hypothetical protein QTO12_05645 [Vibrio owensii]|uniref:hypothetical protein n=1 Tax=Vibrio owensii TaxID=696485 RepID=UPI002F41027F
MDKVRRLSLKLGLSTFAVLSIPWYLSLGTYFSSYTHFQDSGLEVLVTAKSGMYKAINIYEGKVYKVDSGIYATIGASMYFLTLGGSYLDGLEPDFAEKVVDIDMELYSPGMTPVKLLEKEGRWVGKMQKADQEIYLDEIIFSGRKDWW